MVNAKDYKEDAPNFELPISANCFTSSPSWWIRPKLVKHLGHTCSTFVGTGFCEGTIDIEDNHYDPQVVAEAAGIPCHVCAPIGAVTGFYGSGLSPFLGDTTGYLLRSSCLKSRWHG